MRLKPSMHLPKLALEINKIGWDAHIFSNDNS